MSAISTPTTTINPTTASAEDGWFSLRAPATPDPHDLVLVWLASPGEDGTLAFALANPSFGAGGQHKVGEVLGQATDSQLWSFSMPLDELSAGSEIVLGEHVHGGAARVFDYLRYVHNTTAEIYGERGSSLVAWMQPGVSWDCGACSTRQETRVQSHRFGASILLAQEPGDAALVERAHRGGDGSHPGRRIVLEGRAGGRERRHEHGEREHALHRPSSPTPTVVS